VPGVNKVCIVGGCRFRASSATMEELANQLPCQCRIVDETHLSGKYDFVLTADVLLLARPALQAELAGEAQLERKFPDIFSALEKQLGLKLERRKVPSDILYVDHIEKAPTDN
jgi:uncharacterized protein (TIGR03435 family)